MNDVFGEALQKLSSVKPQLQLREALNVVESDSSFDEPVVLTICPSMPAQVASLETAPNETAPLMIFRPTVSDLPDADQAAAPCDEMDSAEVARPAHGPEDCSSESEVAIAESVPVNTHRDSDANSVASVVVETMASGSTAGLSGELQSHAGSSFDAASSKSSGLESQSGADQSSCLTAESNLSSDKESSLAAASELTTQANISATGSAVKKPLPTRARRSVFAWIQDHRRHTAAIVILLCMGVVWYDDGSDSFTAFHSDDEADEFSADSMLSEFDATDARPTKEPADPVETSAENDLLFTIPGEPAFASDRPIDGADPEPRHVAAGVAPPPQPSHNELTRGNPVWTSPTPRDSKQTDDHARAVKFTGRIAPLK